MVGMTSARSGESSSNPGTSFAVATENQEGTQLIENPRKVLRRRKGTSTLGRMTERFDLKSRTEEIFKVAQTQSAWFQAIEKKDCKRLMELLAGNTRLLVETGVEGRTVLHVASMQGCLRLVNQVMDIVAGNDVLGAEGIVLSGNEILKAIDGRTTMTAFDLAWVVIGSNDVAQRLDDRSQSEKNMDIVLYGYGVRDTSRKAELKFALQGVMHEVLQEHPDSEDLKREFDEDVNYNFEPSGLGLINIFHLAVATGWIDFVEEVLKECEYSNVGGLVDYLLRVQDWKGTPSFLIPFKVLPNFGLHSWESVSSLCRHYGDIVDSRGWTYLHCSDTLRKLYAWQHWYRAGSINARLPKDSYGATPLHLAILHGQEDIVRYFVRYYIEADFNAILCVGPIRIGRRGYFYLSPLTMAIMVENERIVELLLSKVDRIYDIGKYKNHCECTNDEANNVSAFHVAAATGKPNILRLFLDNPNFDPLVVDEDGNTTLHYATDACVPDHDIFNPTQTRFRMYYNVEQIEEFIQLQKSMQHDGHNVDHGYSGKQGCINMLLQAGVDIWQKNHAQKLPDPGPTVRAEDRRWWHDKIERETFQVKTNLNVAGNAISVIAALVATASYVGPLQPPLGYGSNQSDSTTYDFVQATKLLVRVYVVANSLSFYFAIASIMFAVVPSLPMPQEGILEELERTRRAVALAIGVLLMSIIAILISFAVASIIVVPEEYSWDHAGLTFYPALVGGIFCFIGILLFFVRMLRLVFPKNTTIRRIYRKFVKI